MSHRGECRVLAEADPELVLVLSSPVLTLTHPFTIGYQTKTARGRYQEGALLPE